ncbi:universal stress protein [Compostimonas suwonensis]|uniref:Nucleotide-binding universal stress UspA family protein n=1 Tax=Compostimonas suwonensis TaxID=1048394 RepID=A0A2M9C3E5_9MICO|nr:universal stress protein [Compostimonas suwonensis]PJJ65070.1 nucleotide-binding universal stress UspA family protein [Compostimonas suwonensis]
MNNSQTATMLLVGIVPGHFEAVVSQARTFAELWGAGILFANVDAARYSFVDSMDGSLVGMPLDPEVFDPAELRFDSEMRRRIGEIMLGSPSSWDVREVAGDPATELGKLAEELDAVAIVVGTREPGFVATMQEFFTGSVAVRLAHHQRRPVIVIPLAPVGSDQPWPWDEGA